MSTRDQHPEAQEDALRAARCEQLFIDKASGRLASRPELDKALLLAARPGDQLVVTKLDRLGRSLRNLIELARVLEDRSVDLIVLDQGIDTSTPAGRLFFHIIGAIAEFEHALMSERTKDGLAAARARGRRGGAKVKLGPRQRMMARQMYAELGPDGHRAHTVQRIGEEFGVSRQTIYRVLGSEVDGVEQAFLVRRMYEHGYTVQELAREFGVKRGVIHGYLRSAAATLPSNGGGTT